jgi:nucleotide-binding universal stress UspA family protein
VRTILLHVEDDASLDAPMQAALSLARATGGHVTCLHATPVEAYVAFDSFGGVFVMERVLEALAEREASLRERVEERFHNADVNWDFRQTTGSIPHALLSHAALADIIVCGRSGQGDKGRRASLGRLGDIIMKSRVPVLVPGTDGIAFDPFGKAVIGWNDSYEAANAVRAALPLLKCAGSVDVIRIEEPARERSDAFPSTRLLEYLSRHDIHAELTVDNAEAEYVGGALCAAAMDGEASYLVIGGYGHSRISEYLFGGVTRAILESSPANVVIAH